MKRKRAAESRISSCHNSPKGTFRRTRKFVSNVTVGPTDTIDYDLDEEDEDFLLSISLPSLSEDLFECAVQTLESSLPHSLGQAHRLLGNESWVPRVYDYWRKKRDRLFFDLGWNDLVPKTKSDESDGKRASAANPYVCFLPPLPRIMKPITRSNRDVKISYE